MTEQEFENYVSRWNFRQFMPMTTAKGSNIRFYFILSDNTFIFPGLDASKKFYLRKDGFFCSYTPKNVFFPQKGIPEDLCYYASTRSSMNKIRKVINEKLDVFESECANRGECFYPRYYLNVELEKTGVPSHVFTKNELKKILKEGDDRVRNTLVINENGYFKLVQEDGNLYPVRFESFDPGNQYVGASVEQDEIDEYFGYALSGWLIYLKHGETVFVDYRMDSMSDEEKIRQIKLFNNK